MGNTESKPKQMSLPKCQHGAFCYNISPDHEAQHSHPQNCPNGLQCADHSKAHRKAFRHPYPICKYGVKCYNYTVTHESTYIHPPWCPHGPRGLHCRDYSVGHRNEFRHLRECNFWDTCYNTDHEHLEKFCHPDGHSRELASERLPPPSFWEGSNVVLGLSKNSAEFQGMERIFANASSTNSCGFLGCGAEHCRKSYSRGDILRLEVCGVARIQCRKQYGRYQLGKRRLQEVDPADLPDAVRQPAMTIPGVAIAGNEILMVHGVKHQVAQDVAQSGLDVAKASATNMFGEALYFTDDVAKADQYCSIDANGLCYMLGVIVDLGRPHPIDGNPGTTLHNSTAPPDGFDSRFGRTAADKFREAVVYANDQVMVQYLIKYKPILKK